MLYIGLKKIRKQSPLIGQITRPRYFIVILLVTLSLSTAYGGDYRVRRIVDGSTLDIVINRNPPVTGKNDIGIEIKDRLGRHVVNASVMVNYYMPPMPGMPPMNYLVKALPHGPGYKATMNLIMAGPWNIVIKAATAEKQLKLTVPIDVR